MFITSYSVLDSGIVHYRLNDGKIEKSEDEIFLLESKHKVGEIDADEYNDQFPSWEAKSSKRGVNVYTFSGDKRAENVPKRTKAITPRKLKKKQTITYAWVTEESVDTYRIAKKDPRKLFRKNAEILKRQAELEYEREEDFKAMKREHDLLMVELKKLSNDLKAGESKRKDELLYEKAA